MSVAAGYYSTLVPAGFFRPPTTLRHAQDVLGKFSGEWELRAVRDPGSGKVVGCRGELIQDVLPKGGWGWVVFSNSTVARAGGRPSPQVLCWGGGRVLRFRCLRLLTMRLYTHVIV